MNKISQRIGIFVDTANLYHSAKHLYNSNVNFSKLIHLLVDGRQLLRAIAYTVSADPQKEKDFIKAVQKAGFEVKAKDLQVFPGGIKKGNWDVGLAVDTIRIAKKIDVAVIVSGDGDFSDLAYFLQHEGLIVEVAGFGQSTSASLKEIADKFLDLDKHKDLLIRNGNKSWF